MLGLRSVLAFPRPGAASTYGLGQGTIWLHGLQCSGNEQTIAACQHGGWGRSNCRHDQDAGMICVAPMQVRLANGPWINQGRVEIYQMNKWGTLCSSKWDTNDALVVCKMLGFKATFVLPTVRGNLFGVGTGPIWLGDLQCTGSETSILQCKHSGWGRTRCGHQQDAGLICKVCPPGKLVCGDKITCIMLEWVCDGEPDCPDGSDERICIKCQSNEIKCDNRKCIPESKQCNGIKDCQDGLDESHCLRENLQTSSLELRHGSQWFPVCSTNWEDPHSEAVCYKLGYGSSALTRTIPLPPNALNRLLYFEISPHRRHNKFLQNFLRKDICSSNSLVSVSCHEKECGIRSPNLTQSFIVGGSNAQKGAWPWMVYIRAGQELCGGTLKDQHWIITAGHCVNGHKNTPNMIKVRLGSLVGNGGHDFGGISVTIQEVILHPHYSEAHGIAYHDIALLKMALPVPYSDYVKPSCLPGLNENVQSTSLCYITGFGRVSTRGPPVLSLPHSLQQAKVRLLPKRICERSYRHMPRDTVCSGYSGGNIGICDGDSGGPLMCLNTQQRWVLVGVSSFSESCAKPGFPAVYTKVSNYISWIEENTPIIEKSIDCDFEVDVCDYQQFADGPYKWYRHHGNAGSTLTGPQTNNIFGNVSIGYYIFAKASLGNRTDKALLVTPLFTARSQKCLHFRYFMYGPTMSTLNVYLNRQWLTASMPKNKKLARTMSRNSGRVWRTADIPLPPGSYFIEFESVRGDGILGDIALDYIHVSHGTCTM